MVVDEQGEQVDKLYEEEGELGHLWCYLVVLRGGLYAVPDEEHAVLMPYINRLATVTPLPLGLVPAYILGLVNVGQNGEVAVDLGAYLGLAGDPSPREQRRLLVIGERGADHRLGRGADDAYRLAFVVDGGHELTAVRPEVSLTSSGDPLVRGTVETRHGRAAVLDMAAIGADIVRALGAGRPWNAPAEGHELPEEHALPDGEGEKE